MTRAEELVDAASKSLEDANGALYKDAKAKSLQSIAESLLAIAVMLKETRKEAKG